MRKTEGEGGRDRQTDRKNIKRKPNSKKERQEEREKRQLEYILPIRSHGG